MALSTGKILAADYKHMAMLKLIGDVRVVMSSTPDNYCNGLYRRGVLDAMLSAIGEVDVRGTSHDVPAADRCMGYHADRASRMLGFSAMQL